MISAVQASIPGLAVCGAVLLLSDPWALVIVLHAGSTDKGVSVQITRSFAFWVVPRSEVFWAILPKMDAGSQEMNEWFYGSSSTLPACF